MIRHPSAFQRFATCPSVARPLATRPSIARPLATFPAASSRSRAICDQVLRRTAASPTAPRFASSSTEIGGNPAVPNSEFTSPRFSNRKRATSSSSSTTYRERKCRDSCRAQFCQFQSIASPAPTNCRTSSSTDFSLWISITPPSPHQVGSRYRSGAQIQRTRQARLEPHRLKSVLQKSVLPNSVQRRLPLPPRQQ